MLQMGAEKMKLKMGISAYDKPKTRFQRAGKTKLAHHSMRLLTKARFAKDQRFRHKLSL